MPGSVDEAWEYLEERFDIGREETAFTLREVNGDIWITSPEMETELEAETYGIRFIRQMKIGLKPTTYGLQLVGDRLEKNVVDLDRRELEDLLNGDMIEVTGLTKGYVALRFQHRVIGCGFYKDELVSSRIPKGRAKELKEILSRDWD